MSDRKTIRIPAPRAKAGDDVDVENYLRRPAKWERGNCVRTRFSPDQGPHWSYEVRLDRLSARGYPIFVTVNDDGIER